MSQLTVNDCNKYIMMIRIEYPNAFPIQARSEKEREELYTMLVASWYRQLSKYPKEVCDRAVMDALGNAREGRYPRIGDVKFQADKLIAAYEKTTEELWAELKGVLRQVSDNIYRYRFTYREANGKTQGENARQRNEDIFKALSPELRAYCQNLRGLAEIAEYTDEQMNYERGRFMRTMPIIKERAKTRYETGDKLAGLIQGLAGRFALECDNTKLLQGE